MGAITEAVGKFAAPAPIPALAAAMTKRWAVIGSEVAGCDGNSGGGSGGGGGGGILGGSGILGGGGSGVDLTSW